MEERHYKRPLTLTQTDFKDLDPTESGLERIVSEGHRGSGARRPGSLTKIEDVRQLSAVERSELRKVTEKFLFCADEYYLSLIDWNDPDDPIRRVVIPSLEELEDWGRLDASDEEKYTVMPGVQHKYNSTVLLLVSTECGGICRYCFRKRIFIREHMEVLKDLPRALDYIREHKEITNVLLTGGDPLMLPTHRIENIISRLREIEHVKIVRIGTKMLSYNAYRILDDPSLIRMIEKHSHDRKKIYIMTHFNHPRELTDPAVKAVNLLQRSGAAMANQTPLIRGVNDKPKILAQLFKELSYIGIRPYYVFQCRPAMGNRSYAVPVEEGYLIFEQARSLVSGLAKTARYVMSHSDGKIEVVGKTEDFVHFKYHRASRDEESSRTMVFRSDPEAYWFDDYEEVIHSHDPIGEEAG